MRGFRAHTSGRPAPRLVLPEGDDSRMIEAASALSEQAVARVTVLGNTESIRAAAARDGLSLQGVEIVDPRCDERADQLTDSYLLGRPGTNLAVARRLLKKPLFFGGMMVKQGLADALLAGASTPTARVVECGLMTIGCAAGVTSPSSFFLMMLADQPRLFADCALTVEPTAEELADIAIVSAASYERLMNDTARVSLLSFSTRGSARHKRVAVVQQALRIVQQKAPGLCIDGELQLDAALDAEIARRKLGPDSPVGGAANVLVFPDLNSGNIAYKLARHLTGALAIGPMLQGFGRPIGDVSRGASVEEIIATAQLLLADA